MVPARRKGSGGPGKSRRRAQSALAPKSQRISNPFRWARSTSGPRKGTASRGGRLVRVKKRPDAPRLPVRSST